MLFGGRGLCYCGPAPTPSRPLDPQGFPPRIPRTPGLAHFSWSPPPSCFRSQSHPPSDPEIPAPQPQESGPQPPQAQESAPQVPTSPRPRNQNSQPPLPVGHSSASPSTFMNNTDFGVKFPSSIHPNPHPQDNRGMGRDGGGGGDLTLGDGNPGFRYGESPLLILSVTWLRARPWTSHLFPQNLSVFPARWNHLYFSRLLRRIMEILGRVLAQPSALTT